MKVPDWAAIASQAVMEQAVTQQVVSEPAAMEPAAMAGVDTRPVHVRPAIADQAMATDWADASADGSAVVMDAAEAVVESAVVCVAPAAAVWLGKFLELNNPPTQVLAAWPRPMPILTTRLADPAIF